MPLTLDTIFERPQFTRFQSGYRLAALTKLCYLYNKEAEDGWLSLPNAAFKQWLGMNWKKRLEETQADGFANVAFGEQQTRWQPRSRFLTAVPEPVQQRQPREQFPSDRADYRAAKRQERHGSDSAGTPQPTPQNGKTDSATRSTRIPHTPVTETGFRNVSETNDFSKKNPVSETVPETTQDDSATAPQFGDADHDANVKKWRAENEVLARDSAKALKDEHSIGQHITLWSHARRVDLRNGNDHVFKELSVILSQLEQQRQQTGKPQGKAWYLSATRMFEAKGYPLPPKAGPDLSEDERAALRAHLAATEGGSP